MASAYAALIIAAPQVIAGSSYEARSGQTLRSAQDTNLVTTLLEETRRLGVFAATTVILASNYVGLFLPMKVFFGKK